MKTKALTRCMVTVQLICACFRIHAKINFFHDVAHMLNTFFSGENKPIWMQAEEREENKVKLNKVYKTKNNQFSNKTVKKKG